MSLQRRLLVYLLLCAPLVWGVALLVSANRANEEVNELFDTEIIRLARQVQVMQSGMVPPGAALPMPRVAEAAEAAGAAGPAAAATPAASASARSTASVASVASVASTASAAEPALGGEADLRDLSIAVWNASGQLLVADREGVQLPRRLDATGFVELALEGEPWRVYYLQSPRGEWLVAAGQRLSEREELVWNLLGSQLLPWLLVLPVLMAAMAWAVRQALAPVRALATELHDRGADDLRPVPMRDAPSELQPLLAAMNGLFVRIESTLARERRFTADAAHELRTPLAVLRAQWDVVRSATDAAERSQAEPRLAAGLDRIDRLVTQMLALSRVEATDRLTQAAPVDWPALVTQVMNDVLALAERRGIELACEWPAGGAPAFVLQGDADLLAVLLRNLLDNAVRYAPGGSSVTLRFGTAGLAVENEGPSLPPEVLARLGERFHRDDGQAESGSGLGVSLAQRIAALHGLVLRYRAGADGRGVVAELSRRA